MILIGLFDKQPFREDMRFMPRVRCGERGHRVKLNNSTKLFILPEIQCVIFMLTMCLLANINEEKN